MTHNDLGWFEEWKAKADVKPEVGDMFRKERYCAENFYKFKRFYFNPELRCPPQHTSFWIRLFSCFRVEKITENEEGNVVDPLYRARQLNRIRKFLAWSNLPTLPEGYSLLRIEDQELIRTAGATYENIFQFMDGLNVNKDKHALYIVNTGMRASVSPLQFKGVRNEIFTQIIKQLTNNPLHKSLVKGIELLGLCLACFKPDNEEFEYFLITWMKTHLTEAIYIHYISALLNSTDVQHYVVERRPVEPEEFTTLDRVRAKLDEFNASSYTAPFKRAGETDPWNIIHNSISASKIPRYDVLDGFFDDFDSS